MQKTLQYIQKTVLKSYGSAASCIMCIVGLLLIFYGVDYL